MLVSLSEFPRRVRCCPRGLALNLSCLRQASNLAPKRRTIPNDVFLRWPASDVGLSEFDGINVRGESLLPDVFRSFDFSFGAALLFAGQVVLVILLFLHLPPHRLWCEVQSVARNPHLPNKAAKGRASNTARRAAILPPLTWYHSAMKAVPAGVLVTIS
jgi:hypothetical protein